MLIFKQEQKSNICILFKNILLKIGCIEMTTTVHEVIQRCLKPCFTIPLIHETRFSAFDFVSLATLRFELSRHQKRMTLQNFEQNKQRDV